VRQRPADCPAEDVDEKQDENDGLDGGEGQQVRLADEMTQVTAGDYGGVGDRRAYGPPRREARPQRRPVTRRNVRCGLRAPVVFPRPGASSAAFLDRCSAGQLQEDIVQRGPAQSDVADADLCPAQLRGRLLY
jgi:hypothetical protein